MLLSGVVGWMSRKLRRRKRRQSEITKDALLQGHALGSVLTFKAGVYKRLWEEWAGLKYCTWGVMPHQKLEYSERDSSMGATSVRFSAISRLSTWGLVNRLSLSTNCRGDTGGRLKARLEQQQHGKHVENALTFQKRCTSVGSPATILFFGATFNGAQE